MKRNIIVFLLTFAFIGCEDFIDVEPEGAPTLNNFWQSEADLVAATNGLYIWNHFQGIYGRGIHLYSLIASDDFAIGKTKSQIQQIEDFTTPGSGSYTRDIWPLHFVVIKRANDIIKYTVDMDVNADAKNFALGQAYFMRGLAYFQLSVLYGNATDGGIPIVDENTDTFFIERPAHVSTSYEFAAENFTKAAELLPYFDQLDSEDYGKPHKNAALGYLARTHLHNAQYDASSWAKVVSACDEVINSGKNELEVNFEDAFKIENNWGSEYLWSVPSNTLGGSMFIGASLDDNGYGKYNGWGYFSPTLGLYEHYVAGDLRRDLTIFAYGDEFTFFGETMNYFSNNSKPTGFGFRKYFEPFTYPDAMHLNPDPEHGSTDLNLPLMRYSHILLMKAEALIQQGMDGDVPLNKVRERAGLLAISGATLEDIKYERRAEFAGELFGRFEDICRWGDADAIIAQPKLYRAHDPVGDPFSSFTVEERLPGRPHFDSAIHSVWPIPPNVISNSNGTLSQNSGW